MFGEYCAQDLMGDDAEDYFNGGFKRKKSNKMKKRFSEEQIKSLESMFQCETKLEPRKKLQLAKELGLQPRQVAIWFQNKRARWKSKQLEREYGVLRANYNSLASQFETLKKEKQSLVVQINKLQELMGTTTSVVSEEGSQCGREDDKVAGNSNGHGSTINETEPSFSWVQAREGGGLGNNVVSSSSEEEDMNSCIKTEYFGTPELLNMEMVEHAVEESLTSSENWEGLDSNDLLDEPSGTSSSQWWDFWS